MRTLGAQRIFSVADDAEFSVEIDPRVTTEEQLTLLREHGCNRLSMGIQDFDPRVQEAIHRLQSEQVTRQLFSAARRLEFDSINVDLIYGLPFQSATTFADTVDRIIDMHPDRIALFSYAHVPWIKPHQTRFSEQDLPVGPEKFSIFQQALARFTTAGYEFIGLDHFALPDDELYQERQRGSLHRNFQGYSTRGGLDLIGFGVTAISAFPRVYAQNRKKLIDYYRAVEGGGCATYRGIQLSDEDLLRRNIISDLMCHSLLEVERIEERFGIDFGEHFATELAKLSVPEKDGIVRVTPSRIEATALGRVFIRNICMVFDEHLKSPSGPEGSPIYSRTI